MIVEFVGCSGAGKTTLMHAVQQAASPTSFVTAWDLLTRRPGRRWMTTGKIRNLAADATSLVPFVRNLDRNGAFVRFALRSLRASAPSTFAALNYTRNLVRRVGMHELARDEGAGAHVLTDEGTVLIAYQLFVYSRAATTPQQTEQFAQLVPAPDRLVHVRAPVSVLIERAMARPDRRRELARMDRRQLGQSFDRATAVFEAVTATSPLRDRVTVVDNPDGSVDHLRDLGRRIAASLEHGGDHQPGPQLDAHER